MNEEEAEKNYHRKDVINELMTKTKEQLVNIVYNRMVSDMSDIENFDPTGKSVPYIGWFWRNADFVGKDITIGSCDGLIGVMVNNKWDYPERKMTAEEVDKFTEMLDRVFAVSWGNGEDIRHYRNKRLRELWDWFQTLKV